MRSNQPPFRIVLVFLTNHASSISHDHLFCIYNYTALLYILTVLLYCSAVHVYVCLYTIHSIPFHLCMVTILLYLYLACVMVVAGVGVWFPLSDGEQF